MKFISLKMILLLALTTAKHVSDLQALFICPSCLQCAPGLTKVSLLPNPAFVSKVVESALQMSHSGAFGFSSTSIILSGVQRLHTLCLVQALHVYVSRSAGFRKEGQLFVSWIIPHKGKPLFLWRPYIAYRCRGLQPPECLKAHPTRGVAISWALFKGVSVHDICAAAMPHTCKVLQAGCLRAILSTISAKGKSSKITVIITTRLNIIYGFEKIHAIQERGEKEFWVTQCNPRIFYNRGRCFTITSLLA